VAENRVSSVENKQSIGESIESGIERSSYPPVCEFAESLGVGGSEYFPLWRLPLWLFTLIRVLIR
jgi:hypothetical protein